MLFIFECLFTSIWRAEAKIRLSESEKGLEDNRKTLQQIETYAQRKKKRFSVFKIITELSREQGSKATYEQ
jgi:hypothetical protein